MEYQFEKLKVWQMGMALAEAVYTMTQKFPKAEQFGLISQMRRAAVSVPANIAEGKGRYYTKEFIQFLYTARGSLCELMTLLQLAQRLTYLTEGQAADLLQRCWDLSGGINGLINSLK